MTYLQRPLQEIPGVVEPEHVVVILNVVLVEQPVQLIELRGVARITDENRTLCTMSREGKRWGDVKM